MKRLLTVLALLLCVGARAAIFQNTFTTNANTALGATSSSTYPIMIDTANGIPGPNGLFFSPHFRMAGTNGFFGGNLSLNGRTNKLSIDNDTLYLDGVAIGGGGDTVWTNDAGWVHLVAPTNHISLGFLTDPGPNVFSATAGTDAADTNVEVTVFALNASDRAGAERPAFFYQNNTYALLGSASGTNSSGANVGVYGNSLGFGRWAIGVVGTAFGDSNNATNTGVYGAAVTYGVPGIYNALVGELTADESAAPELVQETAVLLLEARDTGAPLIIARSNSVAKFTVNPGGALSLQGQTNLVGDNGTALTYNGEPITSTEAAPVNNFFTTNQFFQSGKGNTLIITQVVQFAWTTLTMTGSNVSAMNLTNGSFYKLTLTNDAFMVAPVNFPGTNFGATYQVHAAQDGTGGRTLMLTNGSYVMSGSGTSTNAVVGLNTNANAVTVLTFATSPFTATKLYGVVATTGQ